MNCLIPLRENDRRRINGPCWGICIGPLLLMHVNVLLSSFSTSRWNAAINTAAASVSPSNLRFASLYYLLNECITIQNPSNFRAQIAKIARNCPNRIRTNAYSMSLNDYCMGIRSVDCLQKRAHFSLKGRVDRCDLSISCVRNNGDPTGC